MPHLKSAKKRMRQTVKRREHNRAVKKALKKQLKALQEVAGNKDAAADAVKKEVVAAVKKLDKAAAKGVSYRSYGEWVANGRTASDPATATVKALEGHFDPFFRSFDMDYPDAKRTDRFLQELAEFEKSGEMPRNAFTARFM